MRRLLLLALLLPFVSSAQTRINAGGPSYTASTGFVWAADSGFNNGLTYSTTAAIGGTPDPTLFQTQRYSDGTSTPLTYTFSEPAGNYTVRLLFSEIYFTANGTGQRVFNVKINGTQVLTNFDIFAKVGSNTADTENFPASSTGTITIEFDNITQRALIDAIEIVPAPVLSNLTIGTKILVCASVCDGTDDSPETGTLIVSQQRLSQTFGFNSDGTISANVGIDVSVDPADFTFSLTDATGSLEYKIPQAVIASQINLGTLTFPTLRIQKTANGIVFKGFVTP